MAFDAAGNLYVAEWGAGRVSRIDPTGHRSTQTPDGGYVVSNIGGGVAIVRPDGTRIEAGKAFATPGPGVAITKEGRVFVVDHDKNYTSLHTTLA